MFSERELEVIENLATIKVNNCTLKEKCMICRKPHPNTNCQVSVSETIIQKIVSDRINNEIHREQLAEALF